MANDAPAPNEAQLSIRYPANIINYWKLHSIVDSIILNVIAYAALRLLNINAANIIILILIIATAVFLAVLWIVYYPRRRKYYLCQLSTQYIYAASGRIFRKQSYLRHRQIITVQCLQGPFLRMFHLTKVELGTLGEPLAVGPFRTSDAETLRVSLLDLGNCRGQPAAG